jgi:PAS domain S-box-containing protein
MLDYRLKTMTALTQTNQQLRQEIAERIQIEEKLRTSEAQHRLLTEYATDLISQQTFEGVILYASPACHSILGYTPAELVGRSVYELSHPNDTQAIKQHYEAITHIPDTLTFTYRIRRKDGEYIWFETTNRVLRDPKTGLIKEFLAISRDITARKEADQLKDELVSTVSHELRTPLTSLRGFAELMLKKEFPREKQKEFLAIIHNESVRLTNLINDFLDLQRIESGRQEYHFEGCSLPALLHESVAIFSGGKEHRPFHLILPPQLPMVRADRERIQQVLANLFSNAVKFSPEGSAISVGAQVRDGETVVWVKDQGLGIPQEALPKLFSKFFRVDNQDTRTIGGTGLGLALIKKIVEEHTGKVWVESTVGEGSTFFFTLPLAEAEQHETVLL